MSIFCCCVCQCCSIFVFPLCCCVHFLCLDHGTCACNMKTVDVRLRFCVFQYFNIMAHGFYCSCFLFIGYFVGDSCIRTMQDPQNEQATVMLTPPEYQQVVRVLKSPSDTIGSTQIDVQALHLPRTHRQLIEESRMCASTHQRSEHIRPNATKDSRADSSCTRISTACRPRTQLRQACIEIIDAKVSVRIVSDRGVSCQQKYL